MFQHNVTHNHVNDIKIFIQWINLHTDASGYCLGTYNRNMYYEKSATDM